MKFQVIAEYQIVTNSKTTKHEQTRSYEAPDAAAACQQFLVDVAEHFRGIVTNLVITATILHDKPSIRQMINDYIRDTGQARLVNDELAVNFLDENETIPLDDLGYNSEYGFYSISQFPDLENEAS